MTFSEKKKVSLSNNAVFMNHLLTTTLVEKKWLVHIVVIDLRIWNAAVKYLCIILANFNHL